ncbi:Protein-lysine N-methyltransferase EEF2KMT [Hondaea fermentalgiana]|uniref:Protein-lysine N-methyltransferase EEF2KMT n=1 Tax=Hondaea fermentalgiana TaxID=2315210 RepID=A0A2R5GN37_9STRA|nr:Protein-lysine N-methyltransferase EEF2KMT [Hondaea fermentalgiana]|eukprot:GBG29721.1 Protein-lysine N-methyltransferase EEF2KMT [Hondaea fermentalgiana]
MDQVRWLVRQQAALGEVKEAVRKARLEEQQDWQQDFVAKVALDPETTRWARPKTFIRRLLQFAVGLAEDEEDGVHDDLAECLADAIAQDVAQDAEPWSWFTIGPKQNDDVTCRVRVKDAGMNKVGHLPWEAGLMLAEWALQNPQKFHGKRILEVGAGTGVTGLTIANKLAPASVVLTDFGPDELDNLTASVQANSEHNPTGCAQVAPFDWYNAERDVAELCATQPFDVLLAADCVYDPVLLDCFLEALEAVFAHSPALEAFVLSTQRNKETFDNFVHAICLDTTLSVEDISNSLELFPERSGQHCFFGPSSILLYGAAGANLDAMRLLRISKSAPAKVPIKAASLLSKDEFADGFMAANTPCILRGVDLGLCDTLSRHCLSKDVSLAGEKVPVAGSMCSQCNPDQSDRCEMTLAHYLHCWETHSHFPGYLKDWHWAAARERLDGEQPFTVPRWFENDWLNDFCAQGDLNESDYRFLYLGPAGSSTGLHHDVYLSYSWSYNVSGTKLWILFPEGSEPTESSAKRIIQDPEALLSWFSASSADQGQTSESTLFKLVQDGLASSGVDAMPLIAVQASGDAIFVPSGWYHEVHNLEETLSVNTNWFNEHNLPRVNQFLLHEQRATQNALEDCKETTSSAQEWDDLVQGVMKLNAGINRPKWTELLTERARTCPRDACAVHAALALWEDAK